MSQSAVTGTFNVAANSMIPGQYSGGIRLRAVQARAVTGMVSTDGASATRAAPPSAAISPA